MTKTQAAEYNLTRHLGYTIEWTISPRGSKICKAIKEGFKTIYSTNIMKLNKEVMQAEILNCRLMMLQSKDFNPANIGYWEERIKELETKLSII